MAAVMMAHRQTPNVTVNEDPAAATLMDTQFGSPGKSRFSLAAFFRRSRSGSSSTEGNGNETNRKGTGGSSHHYGDVVGTGSGTSNNKNCVAGPQDSGKKSNIYRRPVTSNQKTKQLQPPSGASINNLSWSCSVASAKRKQFAQRTNRLLWMNESIDADDGECGRSIECGDGRLTPTSTPPSTTTTPMNCYGGGGGGGESGPNRSRPMLSSSPNSIIKKQAEAGVEYHGDIDSANGNSQQVRGVREGAEVRKQTSFKDSVKVYHYDDLDTVTSPSASVANQKLKAEIDDRDLELDLGAPSDGKDAGCCDGKDVDKCLESSPSNAHSAKSNDLNNTKGISPEAVTATTTPRDNSANQNDDNIGLANVVATIFQSVRVEVLENGEGGCDAIRLLLHLKEELDSSETTVKAMSGGYTLLVFTQYRSDSTEGAQCEQFAEKVTLPLKVDPCSVKAFVHKSGCLIIDARLAWNGF